MFVRAKLLQLGVWRVPDWGFLPAGNKSSTAAGREVKTSILVTNKTYWKVHSNGFFSVSFSKYCELSMWDFFFFLCEFWFLNWGFHLHLILIQQCLSVDEHTCVRVSAAVTLVQPFSAPPAVLRPCQSGPASFQRCKQCTLCLSCSSSLSSAGEEMWVTV